MNNQSTSSQQFIRFALLSLCAMLIFNQYFGAKKAAPTGPARPAPTLAQAFAQIDPGSPPALDATSGAAEVKKMDAALAKNNEDEYSYWARLRAGLVEQYILNKPAEAVKRYDEVIHKSAADAVHAQAIYQKGDLQWKQAQAGVKDYSQHDAAVTLEQLVHAGRGSSQFLDLKIYVPSGVTASATALPSGFTTTAVRDLHGTLAAPNPQGVLDRINQYYSTTVFYKIFDGTVKALGNSPAWSYGVAVILFSIFMRLLLQPLNKKQYESMKGMQVIAPEMKKIQQKYEKRKDQQSQMAMVTEIRELQKRHGVSPMLGCGLAAIQIPVFIFVVSPFIQHYEAHMELAGAGFLWIHSLAGPDIPLLVLYACSQFLSIRLSSTPPADEQQKQMQSMMMFFPFVMPFFLRTWPSAFTMFWMTFNILSTVFQYRMMKAADPNKTFIKSLVTMPGIVAPVDGDTNTDAIPARPKAESTKNASAALKSNGKTFTVENSALDGTLSRGSNANGKNGANRNGTGNGAVVLDADGAGGSGLNGSNGEAMTKKEARERRRRR